MSNSTLKILSGLMVAITTALVTQPAFGVAVNNQLVITENSSTSLTATYNGSPVSIVLIVPDTWFFPSGALGGPLIVGNTVTQWTEPGNSNLVNLVSFSPGDPIFSDTFARTLLPINANGASVQVGTD